MSSTSANITATLRALILFDISEEIDLTALHSLKGTSPSRREPAFRHPAPQYVRYEKPPVTEAMPPSVLTSGEHVQGRLRFFEYGVASVELQVAFAGNWSELVRFVNRWLSSPELESRADSILHTYAAQYQGTLKKPYKSWISEDYYIIHLHPITDGDRTVTAEELLNEHGADIAQIVRGDESALSKSERQEVLQSSLSYYPTDLLVAGWSAAFVYDSQSGALPTFDLLEYANSQLLEFRYYDDVLTRVLADVYKRLERRRSLWSRWALAREAESLNTIRLDVRELAERTDNAIKFLSDMFYARAYRLAAGRIGVPDYHNLVNEKLNTAEDLYDSMVNEFHQGRAFVLELMIVIILIIEIVMVFRGKA